MTKINISYDREVKVDEYITINGRRSRIYYNSGYVYTASPDRKGGKAVHRIIMELKLGRTLQRTEHVHHIDGNRMNNSPDNLEVIDGRIHNASHTRNKNLRHNPKTFICSECLGRSPHKARGICGNCYARFKRRKKTIRPCRICGRETVNDIIHLGLCKRCAAASWDHCRACGKSRKEILKTGQHRTPISHKGICRACKERLRRMLKESN